MRVHVGRSDLVPELMRYFQQQSDCVVLQVGETELEVSLLGSYRVERHDHAVQRLLAAFWLENGGPSEPHSGNGHN